MGTLNLTTSRAAVLRAVAAGEVKHSRYWDVKMPNEDLWNGKKVNAVCAWLRENRLIRIGRSLTASAFSAQMWELTDAGREWLAANEETN